MGYLLNHTTFFSLANRQHQHMQQHEESADDGGVSGTGVGSSSQENALSHLPERGSSSQEDALSPSPSPVRERDIFRAFIRDTACGIRYFSSAHTMTMTHNLVAFSTPYVCSCGANSSDGSIGNIGRHGQHGDLNSNGDRDSSKRCSEPGAPLNLESNSNEEQQSTATTNERHDLTISYTISSDQQLNKNSTSGRGVPFRVDYLLRLEKLDADLLEFKRRVGYEKKQAEEKCPLQRRNAKKVGIHIYIYIYIRLVGLFARRLVFCILAWCWSC
jgi:hypothetical protein